jgi:glycosyltransferase involved in cell wall biosynthesis
MRILYSHRVQSRDGQSVHIEELITALRDAGHEVLVVGPSLYHKVKFGGESGLVPLVRRIFPSWSAELAEILYNVVAFRQLRKAYRRFAPEFVYERYNLYHLAGALLRRSYRTKLYLEINSPLVEERARFGRLRFRRFAQRLEQFTWRSADGVFVVSSVLKQMVAATGVPEDRITIIPNGVGPAAFLMEPHPRRKGTPLTVGFIGFIRDWHGLSDVIAGLGAARCAGSIRLVIAGEGPARASLESQVASLELENQVTFLGLQQRRDVTDVIRSFDIAVQPRAVAYASPLKLFEYMACGRAIVAPNQPNIREVLDDGETALLFDPDEPGAVWRAIKRLADHPELRERLGRAALHTLIERDYTWQGNAARITAAVVSGSLSGEAPSLTIVRDPAASHGSI